MKTAFPPSHLVLYFVPNFFGNPVDYNYWGSFRGPSAFNFFETACYVGILPLLLGAWAVRRWREPAFWFFAALTAFAVLAAVGSPVYLVLYYALPGFRELAGLGRILCLAAFGLAGLAALGLDDLLRRHEPARALPVVAIAALSLLGIGAALYVFQPAIAELPAELDFPAYLLGQLGFFLLLMGAGAALVILRARARLGLRPFAGLAIALVTVDLFGFGLRFNPFTDSRIAYPETESTRWLSDQVGHFRFTSLASDGLDWMPHNAPTVFGLRDIHGSDSLRVHRSFELVSPPGGSQSTYPDPDSPLMDALGVRYLMTRREVSAPWRLVRDAEAPIYENPEAMPRAYLLAADDPAPSPVRFLDDEPDRVVLRARCQRDAILVLTDSYYPGWRAWVDGRPASVRRIEDAFRGVALPPGEHSVEMRYDPASFRVGLFLSLLALALVAGSASALLIAARS